MAEWVKNLPAMQETQGREDPLEKETATHSSILAWKIPWREESGKPQSMGVAKSQTQLTKQAKKKKKLSGRKYTHTHTHTNKIRELFYGTIFCYFSIF